jgi:hypothetical protein
MFDNHESRIQTRMADPRTFECPVLVMKQGNAVTLDFGLLGDLRGPGVLLLLFQG